MAYIKTDRAGNKVIGFRFAGREYTRSARTKDDRVARATKARVEDAIFRVESGYLTIPAGAEAGTFLYSGGILKARPNPEIREVPRPAFTLGDLFARYNAEIPDGAKEATTRATEAHHESHLLKALGAKFALEGLNLAALQRYANARAKDNWRGTPTGPRTVLKEVATLRAVWNWGAKLGHLPAAFPVVLGDLRFARGAERGRFETRDAIRRKVARGGLSPAEAAALWECLYLTLEEVRELIDHVGRAARHSFILPMFALAAYAGARRSEICRAEVDDLDLEGRTVTLREKKRRRGTDSFRAVDMAEALEGALRPWLAGHPGGRVAIVKDGGPLTVRMATGHFDQTLANSEWSDVPGFHTLRHSFASILACSGVDEATIDRWMGHQTREQRDRYRHLFPAHRRRAIAVLDAAPPDPINSTARPGT